jgi:hypothetical protein
MTTVTNDKPDMLTQNFRIITDVNPPVLVARDRDENGDEIVRLTAWDNENDLVCQETVIFNHHEAAKRFVADFSDEAAYEFLERQKI